MDPLDISVNQFIPYAVFREPIALVAMPPALNSLLHLGGGERIRTDDPRVANAMLYQLSYTPG